MTAYTLSDEQITAYRPIIIQYSSGIRKDQVDDFIQDVWCSVFRALQRGCKLSAGIIIKISKNEKSSFFRNLSKHSQKLGRFKKIPYASDAREYEPDTLFVREEERDRLRQALKELSPIQAEVVNDQFESALTIREISSTRKISKSLVYRSRVNVLQELRHRMQRSHDNYEGNL